MRWMTRPANLPDPKPRVTAAITLSIPKGTVPAAQLRILSAARADATLASELGSATRDLQKTVEATGDVGAATAKSVADAS
jgi:hypothetical protein